MLKSFNATTTSTLLVFLIISVEAKPKVEMIFDAFDCNSTDPEGYISNLTCAVGKKRRSFSMSFEFKKQINKFNANVCIEIPRKPKNFVIFNLTNLNGCDLLANRNQVTLLQLGISAFERYSNIPKGCPFKKSFLYYIRGFHMDMNLYPAFTFETAMNTYFDFVVKENKILSGFIQGHIAAKKPKKKE